MTCVAPSTSRSNLNNQFLWARISCSYLQPGSRQLLCYLDSQIFRHRYLITCFSHLFSCCTAFMTYLYPIHFAFSNFEVHNLPTIYQSAKYCNQLVAEMQFLFSTTGARRHNFLPTCKCLKLQFQHIMK